MKIAVAGIGYVGLSLAVLLSQKHDVTAVDICQDKVRQVNSRISPIRDKEIEEYMRGRHLKLSATTDAETAYREAELVIIATPTDYDSQKDYFDTSSVEGVIEKVLSVNTSATVVIKSTIPVGFTNRMIQSRQTSRILFSPEFLREARALHDNLYPSRIIVGHNTADQDARERARLFAGLLSGAALKEDVPVLLIGTTEAEAVKLFSNTYQIGRAHV